MSDREKGIDRDAVRARQHARRVAARQGVRAEHVQGIGHPQVSRETLRPLELPPPLPIPSDQVAGIQELLSHQIGRTLRHVAAYDLERQKGAKRQRRYVKHLLEADGDKITVFAKAGMRRPSSAYDQLERFVSGLAVPEFRAPKYYGTIETSGGFVGVWEFVAGRTNEFVRHYSEDDLLRMVRACGAMNAVTESCLREVSNIPVGIKEIAPVAEKLDIAVRELASAHNIDPSPLTAGIHRLAAVEQQAIERLRSIGDRFFSHHDIGSNNLFFPRDQGPLIVIDWEAAFIGAPGGSLRRLSTLPIAVQKQTAQHYVAFMETKGLQLRFEDVLFVMGAVQVFFSLSWGARRIAHSPFKAERAIRWGLRLAPDYFTR